MQHLVAALGICLLILIAWSASSARRSFPWRTVLWALGLDLVLGALTFWAPWSPALFVHVNGAVDAAYAAALEGARLVFGPLALPPGQPSSIGVVLACQVLPVSIVISALMALAYRLGAMQPVVRAFATIFHRTLRISGAESLSAAANIFTGVEAALVVQPYLKGMTRSELMLVLSCGMGTVAANVLGMYAVFMSPVFPGAAGHLIMASVIAIPAAVITAKVMLPEAGTPETAGRLPPDPPGHAIGVMGAVLVGANDGARLMIGIIVCLIALLGLVALGDGMLQGVGHALGIAHVPTLVTIASWPFHPLAVLMGVPSCDVHAAATLLGERLIKTEFVAYQDLAAMAGSGRIHDPRSVVIISYALCGFAHIPSMAVFVGGTAALVPERREDLAQLGLRALVAATLATLMTGAIAGIFASGGEAALGTR
jgi:CNT family concentrative nucleoside transporter